MARPQRQDQYEQGCIQLISCVRPTTEERKNPRYVPQLQINKKAQEIIAQRFEAPISIIVYVGNMGVGKSKLATVTIAALTEEQSGTTFKSFRSGAGSAGLTQGVWMWTKPLCHFDHKGRKKGSVMVLDCEGMGDLDETTGANLYLFCMLMSTTFAVVLRPSRVDRYQCERLYHALNRFEKMKSRYVLPNVCLVALELPEFVSSDRDDGDRPISKDEWIANIFKVDQMTNNLSDQENEQLRKKYQYIYSMLSKIDAINIDYLPRSLMVNSPSLDVYSLLRNKESRQYFKSIQMTLDKLLANGGKRLPGSNAENLFVRPAELANLMGDLIKTINQDREPKTDDLLNRYLTNRFHTEIEKEQIARFHRDLIKYAKDVLCEELNELKRPQTEKEKVDIDQRLKRQHQELKRKCYDTMIGLTRYNILGLDSSLVSSFSDETHRQEAFNELPLSFQHRLNIVEIEMSNTREAEILVERARTNLTIADLYRQAEQKQKLLEEIQAQLASRRGDLQQEKQINESLRRAAHWRVGVAPCACGAPGKAYNMVHINCSSNDQGNLYYYDGQSNRMVCDSCRTIIRCRPTDARCIECGERAEVTRVYKH